MTSVAKIVSGGQTGVDRAALEVALESGIPIGGWVPLGRLAEDGRIPARYAGLVECGSADYAVRTELNVRDADATLVLSAGTPGGGTALTVELARRQGKPLLAIDLAATPLDEAVAEVSAWLARTAPRVLNVAGPRASGAPQLDPLVRSLLRALFGGGETARR